MKRLLIVDDNPLNVFTIKNHLRHLMLITDTASCAADAYALHKHNLYDIILLDYHLPDATGLDMAQHINQHDKQQAHRTVLISISADSNPIMDKALLFNNVHQILKKPVTKIQLLQALQPHIPGIHLSPPENLPEPSTALPDISLHELKKWLPANKNAAQEFITEFTQTTQAGITAMLAAAKVHNLSKIALEAHRLKSPPKAFGMHQLAARLEALQHAAQNDQDDTHIAQLLQKLQDDLHHVEQQLNAFIA